MKRINYLIIVFAVLVCTTACNSLLDQMPNNSISGSSMWTSESQADLGVIGVYAALQQPVQGGQMAGDGVSLGYYAFDVLGMTGQCNYAVGNLFTTGVNPGHAFFSFTWKWCYTGIHRANNAITYIPAISMNDKKRARLIAECKVLRAFFYMRLNELYGREGLGVPIYLEPVSPSECDKGQSPESEVWAQVIKDLTEAINEPELSNNQIEGEGRVSKGAAYAFRGRAYLLMKDYTNAIADFAKVGDCGYGLYPDYKQLFKVTQERCLEMILSVQKIEEPAGYGSRLQKYCGAGTQGAQDSNGCWTDMEVHPAVVDLYETIVNAAMVKPFNWNDYIPEWASITDPEQRKVFFMRDSTVNGMVIHKTVSNAIKSQLSLLAEPWKSMYMPEGNEARIKAAYANRDPRLAYNVVTPYADFLGVNSTITAQGWYTFRFPVPAKYHFDVAQSERNLNENLPTDYLPTGVSNPSPSTRIFYIHRKFVGEGLEFKRRQDNPIDEPIIRYADVLLMWAEALIENNDLSGAKAKVKEVRDRVGIPTMDASFSDQTTARNYVRDERRREFLNEGINFFDEMRWKTLKDTKYSTKFPQVVWGATSGATVYQWPGDHFYTWPVPSAEIEMNKNLQRTTGWTY